MGTITGVNFDRDVYRTQITEPGDNALQGTVTVTLKEPPIGQNNFNVNDVVIVYRYVGGMQRMQGTISRVYGPSKYEVNNLH
jgi:hypothetical protein